jgi:hypothetical protein
MGKMADQSDFLFGENKQQSYALIDGIPMIGSVWHTSQSILESHKRLNFGKGIITHKPYLPPRNSSTE